MHTRATVFGILALLAVGPLTAACDEAEQDRILLYEKGTYLGPQDPPLSEEQREAVRERTRLQQAQ